MTLKALASAALAAGAFTPVQQTRHTNPAEQVFRSTIDETELVAVMWKAASGWVAQAALINMTRRITYLRNSGTHFKQEDALFEALQQLSDLYSVDVKPHLAAAVGALVKVGGAE